MNTTQNRYGVVRYGNNKFEVQDTNRHCQVAVFNEYSDADYFATLANEDHKRPDTTPGNLEYTKTAEGAYLIRARVPMELKGKAFTVTTEYTQVAILWDLTNNIPTPNAEAMAQELVRRWNTHPDNKPVTP